VTPGPAARTLLLSLLVALGVAQPPGGTPAATGSETPSAADALSGLPLYFVENAGQVPHRVAYYVQGSGASVGFTSTGIVYSLSSTERVEAGGAPERLGLPGAADVAPAQRRWTVRQDFVGANRVRPEGLGLTEAIVSYFKGPRSDWHTGLRTYSGLIYRGLWPGIDLVISSEGGHPKSTFHVAPGADPSAIRLAWRGARSVSLTPAGEIAVETGVASFTEAAPVSWQEEAGRARDAIESRYEPVRSSEGPFTYGFGLGAYDRSRPLVIDPVTFVYAGYIGGSGFDFGEGIAVDGNGNAYVAGQASSTEATFPATVGPDLTHNGGTDAFVAKVNAAGTALVYVGYLGGTGTDEGNGIAVDGDGNAYVTGHTTSTEATFPATVGPDLTHNGGDDAFVARVNAAGTALDYAGYIGGTGIDRGRGIAVDGDGNAYVTGHTTSTEATFPVAVGPDLTYNDPFDEAIVDAFVARVNAGGTALDYAGYIGGAHSDEGRGIAVDGDGNAYVTGFTASTEELGFPVTVGPDLTKNGFGPDAFVARVNADGTALDYAGYIGGSFDDIGQAITVDGDGNAYVAGSTSSPESTFPVAVGPDLTYNDGFDDAFVARVNADGTALDYAGYLGGGGSDGGRGIAVDGDGNAYVTGYTSSTEATFPVAVGPDLTHNGGQQDAFVTKISSPDAPSGEADLTLTKADSRDPVTEGDTFAYGLRVTNAGPDPATGVTLVDTLPPEVSFSSAVPGQGTCGHDAGVVTCDLGTITPGNRVQVRINVVAETAGTATNTASATANETDPTSPNEASAETTINAAPNGDNRTLTVERLGDGRGSVVSEPKGAIACGNDCTEDYADGAIVVLKARPRAGTTFDAWGGDCAHAGLALTCTLTMDADKTVTATFTKV